MFRSYKLGLQSAVDIFIKDFNTIYLYHERNAVMRDIIGKYGVRCYKFPTKHKFRFGDMWRIPAQPGLLIDYNINLNECVEDGYRLPEQLGYAFVPYDDRFIIPMVFGGINVCILRDCIVIPFNFDSRKEPFIEKYTSW